MKKEIRWEHWRDDDLEIEMEDGKVDDDPIYEENIELDGLGELGIPLNISLTPPTVKTPLGIFDINSPETPTKFFKGKCWIGHTNFDITETEYDIIDATPGVEAFRVLTRYRFFICIGIMFNFQDVAGAIENQLTQNSDNIVRSIYYNEDGQIKYMCSDQKNLKTFEKRVEELKKDKSITIISLD